MLAVDCETGKVLWRTPNPKARQMTHSSIASMYWQGVSTYVYCTTGGQTTSVLEPSQGQDSYYLVVPTNTSQEGSYGRDSAGAMRPTSGTPCRPQQILPCFDTGGF